MAAPEGSAAPSAPGAGDQRTKLLDAALALMSAHGAAGTSMRQLAAACACNVATIYHYFPSKADLLRSVIEERRYGERMAAEGPTLDADLPPRARLVALVEWLWASALEEEAVLRLLVGEGLRQDPVATASARDVVAGLAAALEHWLRDGFGDVVADPAPLARVVRGHVFALVVEHLAVGPVAPADASARTAELAAAIFPDRYGARS